MASVERAAKDTEPGLPWAYVTSSILSFQR